MIRSIEIKNFKSIKDKKFSLRKLNLLLGLNGMGKSSFIQMLLLLKQSDKLAHGELTLNGEYFNMGNSRDALYQYSKKDDPLSITVSFENQEPFKLVFDYEIDADSFKSKKTESSQSYPIFDFFEKNKHESLFTQNFQYLNANRIPPQSNHPKNYTSVVKNKNIGIFGEYTAHFIETYYADEIQFKNLVHVKSSTKDDVLGKIIVNKTLINQINLWMGEISPGVTVRTTSISSEEVLLEFAFIQPFYGNTNRFKPVNVGFGISYALHVVTALLSSRPGELIIIENPESHIHPRGQAELGKLIAKVAQNDVQIIIETHSDHIINGIRVAIKEAPELSQETVLFYFDKVVTDNEQYSVVTDIEIDSNGELSDYPKNMMDEWSNQLLKLL